MVQCQLLWNLEYAVVNLKRSSKEKPDRSIQKRTQDYMKKSAGQEMKKKHFK